MTGTLSKHFFSPEEYLALEETAEYKSEYYNGVIFAMAGGSLNHNRITSKILRLEGKSNLPQNRQEN
ncbi:Uma2 family endonuclease [Candidatus Chlorohelix sp.]|uniref:Uma2 family endonuclease n=1 Tax=Candidatus Chlorohelix sp. TaxID=3139201 RepID=UPI0031451941